MMQLRKLLCLSQARLQHLTNGSSLAILLSRSFVSLLDYIAKCGSVGLAYT